jgi:DNA-binding IclR family transcriptional regulator
MKLPRTTTGKYSVEAVARALDVLEAFSSDDLTLNEISRRAGLNKSRAFRLLQTLAERGYVDRCEDGMRYQLGVRLFERAANVRRDLKQVAQPFMRTLHKRFNETVNLGVLNSGDVLYIDILESSRPFRMAATVGCRMRAHRTALGKALLAHLPENSSGEQARVSGISAAQRQALTRELALVRNRGFAVDEEQNEPGVACIGAPVFDATGGAIAAISVSGPAHRIHAKDGSIARAVVAACCSVSKSLGFKSR